MLQAVRKTIAIIGMGVVFLCGSIRGEAPEVGASAPPLTLDALLQAPESASVDWGALRGNLVILEFWATWCGPCISAIPHLNELATEFANEPVRFIAITDEDRTTVEAFLEKKPMTAWVGIGASEDTFTSYGVQGIPHMVIVNRQGVILAVTNPNVLNRELISALLRGEEVNFPEPGSRVRPGESPSMPGDAPPLFRVMIQQTTNRENIGSSASSSRGLTMVGMPLDSLIRSSLYATPAEVDTRTELPASLYDVVINRPANSDKSHEDLLKQAIEDAFDLTIEPVERRVEVDILRRIPGVEPKLSPSDLGSLGVQGTRTGYQFTTADMKNVALNIANTLGHPVIDETEILYTFDAVLTFDTENPTTIREAVRESMGLQLVPERRIRTVWVVTGPEN